LIETLENTIVLVTGITGFIGSHLCRRLLREGAKVHGLTEIKANPWRIQDLADKVRLIDADLMDFKAVREAVQEIKPVKIFHLAAYVDVSRSYDVIDKMIDVNIKGTLNLLHALKGSAFDCFINTGTSEEYGDNPVPFHEDQILNPVSPYSASKASTTIFCTMLYKSLGAPTITLRPFLCYGPKQEGNMLIPTLIKKTIQGQVFEMTTGEQTRDFNYVDDVVDAFILASVTPQAVGEIINICSGVEYKVKEVAELVLKLMNSPIKPKFGALQQRPGEALHFYGDNTRAREILGWKPRTSLEEGLKMTIHWFQENYANIATAKSAVDD
jgi:nucleoside-diphosphate-sugar epimerase